MTEWFKSIDGILKSPGHVVLGIFLFCLVGAAVFSSPIPWWPSNWWPPLLVWFLFVMAAVLAACLLVAQALFKWSKPLQAFWMKHQSVAGRRRRLIGLSLEAKAALRIMSDDGSARFIGEPDSSYVLHLRQAGLILVNEAYSRWGRYFLTSEGESIVKYRFDQFHQLFEADSETIAAVRASMARAEKHSRTRV